MRASRLKNLLGYELSHLVVLATIALIFRVLLLNENVVIGVDSCSYVWQGLQLIKGDMAGLDIHFPPLFPLLIGLFSLIFNNPEFAGRLVSIISGSLLAIPVYFLAKEIFDKKVGYTSAILVAFYPFLVDFSLKVLTEVLFSFLLVALILLLWCAIIREKNVLYFFTGIVLAFLYLTKPEAIGYIGIVALSLILFNISKLRKKGKSIVAHFLIVVFGFLLIGFFYLQFLYITTGSWRISGKTEVSLVTADWYQKGIKEFDKNVLALNEDSTEIIWRSDINRVDPLQYILKNRRALVARYFRNLKTALFENIPSIFSLSLFLLLVIGMLVSSWRKRAILGNVFLLLFLAFPLFSYPLFAMHARRFIPFLPIFLIWVASGVVILAEWLHKALESIDFRKLNILKSEVLILSIFVVLVISLWFPKAVTLANSPGAYEYKRVGLSLRDQLPPNSLLMSRLPQIPFYAGSKWLRTPYADFPELIKYVKHKRVDYLVIDERTIVPWRPQLVFLLDKSKIPPALELFYADEKDLSNRVFIYKIKYKNKVE